MAREQWKPVPGYEGVYEVSDRGRVRRVASVMAQHRGRGGYPQVRLSCGGRERSFYVHRLVARAFLGEAPEGHEVNHRDRDRYNPRLANLEYVTRSQNVQHALANGARMGARGEERPDRKLSDDEVREIRRSTQTHRQLAARYGVTHSIIGRIKRGQDWKHVTTTGKRPREEQAA